MASSYVNNLRLEEIATGEQSGTWGDTTNTNLEIIGQAVAWGTRAIANASTDNITITDGALDADRCLGLKLTGGGQACTVTLLPNTSSKTWFMYNATAAALTFTCGSGANVIIPAGQTKVIATDGLGSGGVVHDLLTSVNLAGATVVDDLTVSDDLTVTDDMTVGGTLGVTGVLTGTSLDISGNIDVDGTTNLDVVDIDGAVDMATTLTVAGNVDFNGDLDVDGTTNLDVVDVDGAVNFAADVTFANGADIITATAGTSNFRAGVNAGDALASGGIQNVVVGDEAGTTISTGDGNVAVGYRAGEAVTTGSYNTLSGWNAGIDITEGNNNVAVGDASLFTNTEGSRSVAIGSNALLTQNYSGATNALNTAVGYSAGQRVTTGVQNTIVGALAGDHLTNASFNVAVGINALTADTLGSSSTAIGDNVLATQNFTTGTHSNNVAVGISAGKLLTTGVNNTYIGGSAGATGPSTASESTFVGHQAGLGGSTRLTGASNTAIGQNAGLRLEGAAHSNTFLGREAGSNVTTGDSNIIIGNGIDAQSATADGQINIGGIFTHDATNTLIDSPGDIILDAGGSDILLKVATTTFGSLRENGSNFRIKSEVSDKDMLFLGNDGGAEITALTLKMSDAGAARFTNGTAAIPAISNLSDANTGIFFPAADKIGLVTGGVERIRLNDIGGVGVTSTSGGHFVVNEGGVDSDFRVESSGNSHMLFVDGGDNHVNIGGSADLGGFLNVAGDIVLATSGNPSMTVKTSGAGNNPSYALRAGDSTVFDIAGIFSANPDYLRIGKGTGGSVDTDLLQVFVGGDVEVSNGNLVVGTAGKGINFSAYGSGASIDNNLLNDYEEGTFAPVYAASGTAFGAIVHNTQTGNYTKVGNLVTISIALRTGSYTAGSTDGIVTITGLPFTAGGTDTYPIAINAQDAWTNFMPYQGWVSNTTVTLTNNSGGSDRIGYRTVPVANMTAGANKNRIYLMGTYTTTA